MTPNQPEPHRFNRIFLIVSGLAVLLLITGVLIFPKIQRQWNAPLGPALELPTYTPTIPEISAAGPGATEVALATPLAEDKPTQTLIPETQAMSLATAEPTATSQPLCGGPPLMYILGVGVDTDDDNYTYGLGDAIRVARIDFVTPKVTVLSIPRDIWVEIPGISDHYGITHGKLNQSFFYGSPGMAYYDGPGGGPGLMARTLDLNFGLRVDHYGAVNMITFERIVDALGGIDIYLPYDVDGTPIDDHTEDMGYFTAGQQHFNGEEALRFSRVRKRYNDFTRMDHQTMVICAIKEKLLTPGVLPKIPQIIGSFQDAVITDLSLQQMSQLACLLPQLDSQNILFAGLPDELFTPGRVYSPQMRDNTFIMEADLQQVREAIQLFTSGVWPVEADSGESTCP